MAKWKKVLLCLFTLLVAILAFNTIIIYQASVPYKTNFLLMTRYPLIGQYMGVILFYLAAVILIIAIVIFFVTIFWRKKITKITYKKDIGNLSIQEKAIEKAVINKVNNASFISNPSVDVDIRNNKNLIDIEIYADMVEVPHVGEQSTLFLESLRNDLETMFDFKRENTQLSIELQPSETKVKTTQRVV